MTAVLLNTEKSHEPNHLSSKTSDIGEKSFSAWTTHYNENTGRIVLLSNNWISLTQLPKLFWFTSLYKKCKGIYNFIFQKFGHFWFLRFLSLTFQNTKTFQRQRLVTYPHPLPFSVIIHGMHTGHSQVSHTRHHIFGIDLLGSLVVQEKKD